MKLPAWTEFEEKVVEAAWRDGRDCDECPYYRYYADTRYEPGGTECRLLEYQRRPATECQGYVSFSEQMREDREREIAQEVEVPADHHSDCQE